MKMNKDNTIRIAAAMLGVVVSTALVGGGAYAFTPGENQTEESTNKGNFREAIETQDYSLLGENPRITQEQFEIMIQAKALKDAGDFEGAKALMEESGIDFKQFKKGPRGEKYRLMKEAVEANDYSLLGEDPKITEDQFNTLIEAKALKDSGDIEGAKALMEEAGLKFKKGMKGERNGEVRAAVEAGDYSLLGEDPKITEDQFNTLVEAKALRDAGDTEAAKALLEEAGLKPNRGKKAMRRGFRNFGGERPAFENQVEEGQIGSITGGTLQ